MKRPEILAPAGSFDAFVAAVRCGADAVYLGTEHLNARRNATNFTDDELAIAGLMAKERGVSIYLTVNTLVSDGEFDTLKEVVKRACTIGADALILQDIGVARFVREMSDIPLHASTQMSVHTVSGVRKLQELGFSRVVLQREMSKEETDEICRETDIETEMFVHGALCMSVSGQCLMSAMLGSRSGNRGLCAQPCRLPFSSQGGTGYDLSLKDLSLTSYLKELGEMGIDSFKIEGRMKRPEYVAAAVTACKSALEGETDKEIFEKLRNVFSRSGFTDGYYTEKRGISMFGTRVYEDVTASSSVLSDLRRLYEKEEPLYTVDFHFVCKKGEKVSLSAVSDGDEVTVLEDEPQIAQKKALDSETLKNQLSKCGGTLFKAGKITCELSSGMFLPSSCINELRRNVLEKLLQKKRSFVPYSFSDAEIKRDAHKAEKTKLFARFTDKEQIPQNLKGISQIILPIYCDDDTFVKYDAVAELPRIMFGRENEVLKRLLELKALGVKEAVFSTLDGLAVIEKAGLKAVAGFGSNIFNTESLKELERLGVKQAVLSCELTLKEAARLGGDIERGVIGYGKIPLMITRNCPVKNGTDCKKCQRNGCLTDRKGIEFSVDCRSGLSEILNSVPIYLGDKRKDTDKFDFVLLYFTKESRNECEKVLSLFEKEAPFDDEFTRGLLYRGVI